jgi:hypothetical protein
MIDVCLHAPTRETLMADLTSVGLAADGEVVAAGPDHHLWLGRVVATPGVVDADGVQVEPETYLPGFYAAVRCGRTTARALVATPWTSGMTTVDRPEGVPVLSGEAESLAAVSRAATARGAVALETFLAPYAREYGALERDSWATQLAEARAYVADAAANTPWLTAAAASRGMDKGAFAARILANAAAWAAFQGAVTGRRLVWQDVVDGLVADVAAGIMHEGRAKLEILALDDPDFTGVAG